MQQRRAIRRVRLNVLQARLHPSVVAWNLANEVAGNGHYGGQPEYVDAAAQLVHRLDPGRPTAVDVWGTHMPDRAGFMYRHIDAVGATNYEGWYDDTLAPPATVQAAIDAWLARLRATFPGKVLIVSEFGAEANRLNAPGTPGSESFQSNLLTRHIRTYEATPWLDGELVWNLQDFALAPSFAGGSIRRQVPTHQPRARDQPEGPVHLRRAAQAGGRGGAAGVRGLSARRVVVVVRVASAALRGAYCSTEGRRVAGAARPLRARRRSRRGVAAHFERVLQHFRAGLAGADQNSGRVDHARASPRLLRNTHGCTQGARA